ncbi:MAG: hypothetical protein M0Z42_24765 [Actinomycetota bacterium]|nr:hypothetical protein [Actinomycetota bacterium]
MVADDGRHDRQTEASPSGDARTRGVSAEERVEDAVSVLRVHAGAVIGHFEQHMIFKEPNADLDRHPLCGVLDGIRHQVVHDLSETRRVSMNHGFGWRFKDDVAVGRRHTRSSDGRGDHRDQVHGSEHQGSLTIEASQKQQVVDEKPHAVGFLSDAMHGDRQVSGVLSGAIEDLGVSLDRRERRTQLVGRVSQEAAQALLGRGAGRERFLNLCQHRVQGRAQTIDLGASSSRLHPPPEITSGNGTGCDCHVVQRSQAAPNHPQGEKSEADQHSCADEHHDEGQPPERLGHRGERDRHRHHETLVTKWPDEHSVRHHVGLGGACSENRSTGPSDSRQRIREERRRWRVASVREEDR